MKEINEKKYPVQLVWTIKNIVLFSLLVLVITPFMVITGCNGNFCYSGSIPQTFNDLYMALIIILIGTFIYDFSFIFYRNYLKYEFYDDKFIYSSLVINKREIDYNKVLKIKIESSLSDQAFNLASIKITYNGTNGTTEKFFLQGLKKGDVETINKFLVKKVRIE